MYAIALSEKERKARKAHTCTWCGECIQKGSTYVCAGVGYDHQVSTLKFHVECKKAWGNYDADDEFDWYSMTRGCACVSGTHKPGECQHAVVLEKARDARSRQ